MDGIKSRSLFTKVSSVEDADEWNDFILNHQHCSAFHELDFLDLMNSCAGTKAYAITERRKSDNKLLSAMIITVQRERGLKGWLSRRAIVYGGPLWTNESDRTEFIHALDQLIGGEVIYLEFRNFMDLHEVKSLFQTNGYEYLPYVNFILPIADVGMERLIQKMNYNRKREIRLSIEQGAKVAVANDESEIRAGYEILKELYLKRVKLPLPGWDFFSELVRKDIGRVFVVKHNNLVIGASFCIYNSNGIFTWYYCGLRGYHKKIFPTHLAILGAMEFAVERGLKWLDFMGAGLKGEEYGVRKYKQEFAGDLVEYGRYRKVFAPVRYRIGVYAIRILQKLK